MYWIDIFWFFIWYTIDYFLWTNKDIFRILRKNAFVTQLGNYQPWAEMSILTLINNTKFVAICQQASILNFFRLIMSKMLDEVLAEVSRRSEQARLWVRHLFYNGIAKRPKQNTYRTSVSTASRVKNHNFLSFITFSCKTFPAIR